jgi:hypothetical protein
VQLANKMTRIGPSAAKLPVILSSEDRIRMTRLYEEVLTRLEEMAMITARTLKIHAGPGSTIKFNPIPEAADVDFASVEIVCLPDGFGCYDYREGACFERLARQVGSRSKNEVECEEN